MLININVLGLAKHKGRVLLLWGIMGYKEEKERVSRRGGIGIRACLRSMCRKA